MAAQEQAQRAVRERCQQSLAIRKEAIRLVDEVEADDSSKSQTLFWVVVTNIFIFTPVWGRFPPF